MSCPSTHVRKTPSFLPGEFSSLSWGGGWGPGEGVMPRPPRVDEAGAIDQAPNRGNASTVMFYSEHDDEAFARVVGEGL